VTTGWRRRAKQTFEQLRKPVELSASVGDERDQRLDIEVQFESTIIGGESNSGNSADI
jgi:hypothetical protein